MFKLILDFLFPPICLFCGDIGEYVCNKCKLQKLKPYSSRCHVCEERSASIHSVCKIKTYLDGVFISYEYNQAIKKIMMEFKYNGYFSIAEFFANEISNHITKNLRLDLISFVPLHFRKRWARGFNQSELIAKHLSKKLRLPIVEIVQRVQNTRTQTILSRIERKTNLTQAFELSAQVNLNSESILLVDDIMSTGSTLENIAKVIKQNYTCKIYALVLARGT